jgi:hypothetical protein
MQANEPTHFGLSLYASRKEQTKFSKQLLYCHNHHNFILCVPHFTDTHISPLQYVEFGGGKFLLSSPTCKIENAAYLFGVKTRQESVFIGYLID